MSTPPTILPTRIDEGWAPGIRYRIAGELVPVLHCILDGSVPLFFEHHLVLWKDPQVGVTLRPMRGAVRRIVLGMPVFLTQGRGPGSIALSRDAPGHVFPVPLARGEAVLVREHQFLAASGSLRFTPRRIRGLTNNLFGGNGLWLDRFEARDADGVVWLHGYGNVFEKELQAGEAIDVEPGGWVYMDPSVRMRPQVYGLRTGIFGGGGRLVFNRFEGPGRVGIQSLYVHLPTGE